MKDDCEPTPEERLAALEDRVLVLEDKLDKAFKVLKLHNEASQSMNSAVKGLLDVVKKMEEKVNPSQRGRWS